MIRQQDGHQATTIFASVVLGHHPRYVAVECFAHLWTCASD